MKKHNNFIIYFFSVVIVLTLLIVSGCIFGDPFQQYRSSEIDFEAPPRYLNPGIAKTHNYDTAIIGSSMISNIKTSLLKKEYGFQSIKFALGAATAREESLITGVALSNKNVKRIIYGLDLYSFEAPYDRLRYGEGSIPEYLYDDSYLNDYYYFFNFDVWKKIIENLVSTNSSKKTDFDYDKYGSNFQKYNYSKKSALYDFYFQNNRPRLPKDFKDEDLIKSLNLNLVKHIKENPEIEFIVFFPPYSILWWVKHPSRTGILDNIMRFKKEIYSLLSQYPNVRMVDFQVIEDITLNFDNYADTGHYSPSVSDYIVKNIYNPTLMLNGKSIMHNDQKLRAQIKKYSASMNVGRQVLWSKK